MDLAIAAILKEYPKKTLFCYGNGSFRTGINLASPHEAFKTLFAQEVRSFFLLYLSHIFWLRPIPTKKNTDQLSFVYDYRNRQYKRVMSLYWWMSS